MRLSLALASTPVLFASLVAHAQPGAAPPPGPAPMYAAEPPATEPLPGEGDAQSGTVFIAPTAVAAPAGTFSLQSTELLFVGAGYAFTDRFSMSAHTLIPIDPDEFQPFVLTAKYAFPSSDRLHIGIQGLLLGAAGDEESALAGVIGGIATYCFDRACNSLLNGYIGAGFGISDEADNGTIPLAFSGGLVQRVTNHVKLVVELDTAALVGEYDETAGGLLAWYGLRFGGSTLAATLGLVKPICDDCDTDEFPAGFPFVSFTYRGR